VNGPNDAEPGRARRHAVIPELNEYLSFLMGVDTITDDDLTDVGVKILRRHGAAARELLVPSASLASYTSLVRERLNAGFWNEIVGSQQILFIFKLADGTVVELALAESTAPQIAQLCSSLNGDALEKTSDVLGYLAKNSLYRDLIAAGEPNS
jgi:hypothetical protein